MLFSEPGELFASAVDRGNRVRLANPAMDEYRSFDALARFHVGQRPVLLGLYRPLFDDLNTHGAFAGWTLEQVAGNSVVVLFRLRAGPSAVRSPGASPSQPDPEPGGGGAAAGVGAPSAPTSAPAATQAPHASRAPA